MKLFIEGASHVRSDFALDANDLDHVADILRLTGGLPLAILLAAAWVNMLNVREIAQEIVKSPDFLETEIGDVPDRHRSIRAVFDYSWTMLSEDERRVFAALSVFRGGFSREAASAVADASLRNLANLANKSLVVPNPDTGRYTVHELLRQYAEQELMKDGDRCRTAQQAHADFFAELIEGAAALFPVADHLQMMDIIETDIDNSRSAFRYMLATHNAAGTLRFIPAFMFAYEMRGWYAGGLPLFGEVLTAFGNDEPTDLTQTVIATAEASRAYMLILMGQASAGTEIAEAALDRLPDPSDTVHRLIVVTTVALGYGYLGRAEELIELLSGLLEEFEQLHDPFWASGAKNWLSFGYVLVGDTDVATKLLSEALEVFERVDDYYFTTWTLWLQAMIATSNGDPERSIELSTRQMQRAQAIGYPRGSVIAQESSGDANLAIGRYDAAQTAYIASIGTAEQMGMTKDMLGLMSKLAGVWSASHRNDDAVAMLATISLDPTSTQQMFSGTGSIRETSIAMLEEISLAMDSDAYEAAYALGATRSFDDAVNALLGRTDI